MPPLLQVGKMGARDFGCALLACATDRVPEYRVDCRICRLRMLPERFAERDYCDTSVCRGDGCTANK
jgi:hypothetical protein